MQKEYTLDEIKTEMTLLKNTFDVVRLVDPVLCEECVQKGNSTEFEPSGCFCFQVWNKNERCSNCISAMAISQQKRLSKFEYIGNTLYYIIARYVVVDGNKYSLECVSQLNREYSQVFLDSDKRTQRMLELYKEVRVDTLTGLYNRRYISEKLQTLVIDARVNQKINPVVAYVDVDHLKYVNDTYGHNAGDAEIVAVADTMMKFLEQNDDNFVARISGDEFLVCVGDSTITQMKQVIEKIIVEVSRTSVRNYPQLKPSISAGIAEFKEANTYDQIIELADRRLHKAKEEGRGTVVVK